MNLYIFIYPLLLLLTLYKFWTYSKRDGFDLERSFDILFVSTLFGFLLQLGLHAFMFKSFNAFSLLQKFSLGAFLYGLALGSLFFCLKIKWSIYRVLDNLAVSLVLSFILWFIWQILFLGFNIFYFIWVLILTFLYFFLGKYRIVLLKSGFTFSILFFVYGLFVFFARQNLADLIFAILLFKLSLIVLIFRLRYLYAKTKSSSNSTHFA